ncbi:MAG: YbbR-like domain-containing protein [Acetanaerobacterium sp.]
MKMKKLGIRKLLYNDRVLMILSIILGIIVWAFVVNVIDPDKDQGVTGIPVTFDNESLERLGLSVISLDNKTVEIGVLGNRMTVSELKADDFIASVSLVGVDVPGTYDLEVQVSKKLQNTDYDIIQPTSPIMVHVRFDKYVSKKITLSADLSSLSAPLGYIMERHYITPGEVTVSGPETDVARVSKCMVVPELPEKVDKTYIVSGGIVLYDVMGELVDMTNLRLDRERADVTIPVLKQKTLPIEMKFINIPANFPIDELDYTLSDTKIRVAGPAETVDTLSEINIGYLDLKLVEPESVFAFDVELPEGFVNIDNITTVKVDFAIADFEVRKFNIKTITTINEPANYNITIATKGINNVSIVGPPDVLDQLTAGDIVAEVDLADHDLGTGSQHNVPVQIVIPSRGTVWAIGDYSVVITAREK